MPDRIPNIVAYMVAKAATLRHDAAAAKDPEIGKIRLELAGARRASFSMTPPRHRWGRGGSKTVARSMLGLRLLDQNCTRASTDCNRLSL